MELAHLVYGLVYGANLPEKLQVEELDTLIAYGGLVEGFYKGQLCSFLLWNVAEKKCAGGGLDLLL